MRSTTFLRAGMCAVVLGILGLAPATASAWTTGLSGTLTWTLPNTPSSFLGTVLAGGGSVTATSPATVGGRSTTYAFPINAQGSYSPEQNEGTLGAQGGVTFASTQAGFPISINDPQIDLNNQAKSGVLYANGTGVGGAFSSGGATPNIIDLNLSKMTVKQQVGQNVVSGITATIDTTGNPFPASFLVGSSIGTIGFTVDYVLNASYTARKGRSVTLDADPMLQALKGRSTGTTLKQSGSVIATGTAAQNGAIALTLKPGKALQATTYTLVLRNQKQPVQLTVDAVPGGPSLG